MKKVKFFEKERYGSSLEKAINEFALTYNIIQISYSITKHGYTDWHSCLVLYEEK